MNENSVKGLMASGKLSSRWKQVAGQSRNEEWSCHTYKAASNVWKESDTLRGLLCWNARVVRHSHVLGGPVAVEVLARTKIEAMRACESIESMPL